MEFIFVRHGEPVSVRTAGEPADPPLSERGSWQADRVSRWLAAEPVDARVTSNKTRAQQTVAPLAAQRALAPRVVADLDEIDRRAPIYAPIQHLAREFPDYWQKIVDQRWDEIGWDAPEVFRDRVLAAYEALVRERPGERVVVGCHGGVIGVVLSHVVGVATPFAFANLPFASISRVVVDANGRAQVRSISEVGHFDATRTRVVGPDGEGFAGRGWQDAARELGNGAPQRAHDGEDAHGD